MAQNTKIARTKKSLLDAFCRMARHTRVEDITVSALCREAGINRTTFYKYYTLPADVVTEAVRGMAEQSAAFSGDTGRGLYDIMLQLAQDFYDNRTLMTLYFQSNGNLLPIFYHAIEQSRAISRFPARSVHYFLAGGIGGIATYWMQRDFRESPEDIAQQLTDLTLRCLNKEA